VGNLWDSGHRFSSENTNILCAGKSFPDNAKVCWKVKTWDKKGNAGNFSKPSVIEIKRQTQAVAPQRRPTYKLGKSDLEFTEGRHGKALRFGPNKPRVQAPDYRGLHSRKGITISA